jgi:hypothetical protein
MIFRKMLIIREVGRYFSGMQRMQQIVFRTFEDFRIFSVSLSYIAIYLSTKYDEARLTCNYSVLN